MSTGRKFNTVAMVLLLCLSVFCIGMASQTSATTSQTHRKTTKKLSKKHLAPLPSGPTGPVQQVPLDSMAPVPPQVSYQNSQLTIDAPNSTLSDILRAVRKQTGAEIEVPVAPERVNSNRNSHTRGCCVSTGANLHFLAASFAMRAKYLLEPEYSTDSWVTLPERSTITRIVTLMRPRIDSRALREISGIS